MIRSVDRISAAFAGLLLVLALVYLGTPRLLAAVHGLPGDRIANTLKAKRVPLRSLERLRDSRSNAFNVSKNPQYADDIGRANNFLSSEVDAQKRMKYLLAAKKASLQSILHRPYNASAWWRLSRMEERAGGNRALVKSYLLRSVETQSISAELMEFRLRSIVRNWREFSDAEREALKPQFIVAWRFERKTVERMAMITNFTGIVRAIFASHPNILGALEVSLSKRSGKS